MVLTMEREGGGRCLRLFYERFNRYLSVLSITSYSPFVEPITGIRDIFFDLA